MSNRFLFLFVWIAGIISHCVHNLVKAVGNKLFLLPELPAPLGVCHSIIVLRGLQNFLQAVQRLGGELLSLEMGHYGSISVEAGSHEARGDIEGHIGDETGLDGHLDAQLLTILFFGNEIISGGQQIRWDGEGSLHFEGGSFAKPPIPAAELLLNLV